MKKIIEVMYKPSTMIFVILAAIFSVMVRSFWTIPLEVIFIGYLFFCIIQGIRARKWKAVLIVIVGMILSLLGYCYNLLSGL